MRILHWVVLCAALLCLPVQSMEAEAPLAVLQVTARGADDAGQTVCNEAAYTVCVYAGGGALTDAPIQLYAEHRGERRLVYAGRGDALADGRVLLCTLESGGTAELWAISEAAGASLSVQAVRAHAPGTQDTLKLMLYVCIWVALVVLGSYIALVIASRRKRKK